MNEKEAIDKIHELKKTISEEDVKPLTDLDICLAIRAIVQPNQQTAAQFIELMCKRYNLMARKMLEYEDRISVLEGIVSP